MQAQILVWIMLGGVILVSFIVPIGVGIVFRLIFKSVSPDLLAFCVAILAWLGLLVCNPALLDNLRMSAFAVSGSAQIIMRMLVIMGGLLYTLVFISYGIGVIDRRDSSRRKRMAGECKQGDTLQSPDDDK